MNELIPIPTARPLTAPQPVSGVRDGSNATPYEPHGLIPVQPNASPLVLTQAASTDRMAVASAICGFTGIIPIVSQVLGLWFGIAALRRVARARREGVLLPGGGWAWTGIITSGLALVGWAAFLVALTLIGSSFAGSQGALQDVLRGLPTAP